ncbi:MAG: nitroreductase family protein [Bacteroidales bacterium]|nr:nitroreductase family protein [Bacteroidales bacterium]
MELYEGLITRRSVRKYTGEKISGDAVNRIVAAGMNAPSARNTQPWHFIVIDDRGMFEKIMVFHPYSSMLSQASHAVAVCFDENLQHGPGYGVMDCSAAAENILLAAHAMGLGAVWLGIHPKPDRVEALGALLGTPPHVRPLALIALGIPAEKSEPARMRYEEEKIRYNHW